MRLASDKKVEPGLLETILHALPLEVFVVAADSLRIEQANSACLSNLQYSLEEFLLLSPVDILADGQQAAEFMNLLSQLQSGKNREVPFAGEFCRKDGTTYPVEVKLLSAMRESRPVFVLLVNDLSLREEFRHTLDHSTSGLHAIISHIPGMAYQVFRSNDGVISMPYVSEKSLMLLGINAQTLRASPELFFDLVLPEDKQSYLDTLAQAGGAHMTFNWEGRIWVEDWNDTKWVSCRVSQRTIPDGTMWDGIMLNITHSKQAEEEIKRSHEELSALTSHVQAVKEQERLRISREIHDELGGYLTAIKIGLSLLSNNMPENPTRALERAAYLDSVVDRTIEAIHRIAADLRPPLVDFGIVPAIEWQLKQFGQDFDIPCEFFSSKEHISMSPDASIAVLRIAQEALTNIAKHAHASRVGVRMKQEGDELFLEITDNGVGLLPARIDSTRRSFGVLGMIERATALGGELQIKSASDTGTTVSLRLPITPPECTNAAEVPLSSTPFSAGAVALVAQPASQE